jgi:hypothetical protein
VCQLKYKLFVRRIKLIETDLQKEQHFPGGLRIVPSPVSSLVDFVIEKTASAEVRNENSIVNSALF